MLNASIIKSSDLTQQDYRDNKVTDILNSPDWPTSLAKVIKVGDDIKTGYDQESDVLFYVLDGVGITTLNGIEYNVEQGDTIVCPKGTQYKNSKGLTLLAIACPQYDRKKRIYIE